mmetsp:Transcript_72388/g.182640  ORF Transcript_72388/g.182640 Transcript_72388/m.182640 type:complete len:205 (+) Transcript_72388:56-670(+)
MPPSLWKQVLLQMAAAASNSWLHILGLPRLPPGLPRQRGANLQAAVPSMPPALGSSGLRAMGALTAWLSEMSLLVAGSSTTSSSSSSSSAARRSCMLGSLTSGGGATPAGEERTVFCSLCRRPNSSKSSPPGTAALRPAQPCWPARQPCAGDHQPTGGCNADMAAAMQTKKTEARRWNTANIVKRCTEIEVQTSEGMSEARNKW